MRQIEILKQIRTVVILLIRIFFRLFLGFMVIAGFFSLFLRGFLDVDNCLDKGGVWDDEYGVCRFDCYHWDKYNGCDLIPDDELEDAVNGYCRTDGRGLYRCNMARLEHSKRKLYKKMYNSKAEK